MPALFAALSVHSIVIRRKDPIRSQLAENRSRQCMLALSELSRSWPVGGWILQLFITVMHRLTGRDFGFQTSSNSGTSKPGSLNQIPPAMAQNESNNSSSLILGTTEARQYSQSAEAQQINTPPPVQDFDIHGQWQYGQELNSLDFLFQDALFPVFGHNNYYVDTNNINN